MKRLPRSALIRLLLAVLAGIALCGPVRAADTSPVGTWRTFDDDGKESGAVRIFEQNGMIYGDVAAIADPAKAKALCQKCTGDRKDKPVLGLQILRGMKLDGDRWDGGEILDPNNGETYRCILHVEDGGQTLRVRGFIGISLLGRTQVWRRE